MIPPHTLSRSEMPEACHPILHGSKSRTSPRRPLPALLLVHFALALLKESTGRIFWILGSTSACSDEVSLMYDGVTNSSRPRIPTAMYLQKSSRRCSPLYVAESPWSGNRKGRGNSDAHDGACGRKPLIVRCSHHGTHHPDPVAETFALSIVQMDMIHQEIPEICSRGAVADVR